MKAFLRRVAFAGLIAAGLCMLFTASQVWAQEQGLVVVVNDYPITHGDITQRIQLLELLGNKVPDSQEARREVLKSMVDEVVLMTEAKKRKAAATEREIDTEISRMVKGMKTDGKGFDAKLKAQNIEMADFRRYIAAQIATGRMMSLGAGAKDKPDKDDITPAAVDAKLAEIKQGMEH